MIIMHLWRVVRLLGTRILFSTALEAGTLSSLAAKGDCGHTAKGLLAILKQGIEWARGY